jgi:hypothetical protein
LPGLHHFLLVLALQRQPLHLYYLLPPPVQDSESELVPLFSDTLQTQE